MSSQWEGHFAKRARSTAKKRLVGGVLILAMVVEIWVMWAVVRDAPHGFWSVFAPVGGGFVLLGIGLATSGLRILRDPFRHRIYRALGDDPAAVAKAIEEGLDEAIVFGKLRLTTDWLIYKGNVVPLTDILWFYRKSTKYSVNFLPIGTVSCVEIYTTQSSGFHDMPMSIPVAGVDPAELIATLAEKAPWAMAGFRPDWKQRWHVLGASLEAKLRAQSTDGGEPGA